LKVVGSFELCRSGVARVVGDLAVKPAMVEPVDVAKRCELDVVETAPRPSRIDQLPLVEPVEALGESIDAPIDVNSV